MKEKRRHPRIPVNLPLVLRCAGRIVPATMMNLSCGGMFIRTEGAPLEGAGPVEVIFDIDDEKRDVSMRGRITRVDKGADSSNVGVQFTSLFSKGHKVVQELVRKNLH